MSNPTAALIARYAQSPPERRAALFDAQLATTPRCPITRYLAGCLCFDRARPATAVRHMMIAHHAEPELESAALLVFAGLNWISRPRVALLAALLDTWEEFRRPEFDRTRRERQLLDAFAEPDPGLERVTPLARRLWRLPSAVLREQIRAAIASRDAGLHPSFMAHA